MVLTANSSSISKLISPIIIQLFLIQVWTGPLLRMPRKKKPPEKCPKICIIHDERVKDSKILAMREEAFDRIQNLAKIQRSNPACTTARQNTLCKQIPTELKDNYGYHRKCYQRFMNVKAKPTNESVSIEQERPKRQDSEGPIFRPNCIFCDKFNHRKIKRKGVDFYDPLKSFGEDSENIVSLATAKNDDKLLHRIKGFDLVACQAKFHHSCKANYSQVPSKWQSQDLDAREE